MNRSITLVGSLVMLAFVGCGHAHPADPSAAPAPWPKESTPAAARPVSAPSAPAVEIVPPKDREIPGEGPARPFVLPKPERVRLASGIELLLVKRSSLPLATIVVVWPNGAAEDPPQREGLAALAANLLTEGAGSRSALELAAETQRLGARLSSQASWDSTTVALTTLTKALDPSLALLADVVLRPRFDNADIERLRAESRTSLLQLNDQPATQAQLAGSRAIYGDAHRYGSLIAGSEQGLSLVSRAELLAWHKDRLSPARATIIAVGDLDMSTLRRKLDPIFGTHLLKRPARIATKKPAPTRNERTVVLVDRPQAAQTEMRAYSAGPPRITPDYFPRLLLNTIFGGNFSSWLNAKLREEKGYTYGARSDFAFRRDGGPFVAGAPVKTGVTKDALVDLLAQLDRLERGDFAEVELTIAKQQLQRSIARSFETPPDVAMALATVVVYGLPESYFTTYAENLEKVSVADLARVAKTLHAGNMSLVFVGDEKLIGADIKAVLGEYKKVDVAPKVPPHRDEATR